MAGKADVQYDPSIIMPHQVANKIKDLGYGATVIDTPAASDGKIELLVRNYLSFLLRVSSLPF